ncbi:hypothetical protein BpHYR1_027582 [Brachionus plicatilis]|uniref:Uncharacterized protein n=1 Tax=Brachionus plicatilis TaxID=10195 RepID=A0A3M7R7H7_BRAPC|nr:hypothetical protein BpHYR1_027582 [Brachionus plicatilis]
MHRLKEDLFYHIEEEAMKILATCKISAPDETDLESDTDKNSVKFLDLVSSKPEITLSGVQQFIATSTT